MPETVAHPGTLTRWVVNFLNVPRAQIVGCTEADLAEVEKLAGRPLPAAYRQMLREIGRSVGTGNVHAHFRRSRFRSSIRFDTRSSSSLDKSSLSRKAVTASLALPPKKTRTSRCNAERRAVPREAVGA